MFFCCHQRLILVTAGLEPKTLSLRFNGHFPSGPGLASARMPPFSILLELRMTEVLEN